jgi:hypothetical protein
LNFWLCKGPSSDYNSNSLKKGSLRKCPYFHIGHWEEFKDGMSSDAIEGEPSPFKDTSIISHSMATLKVLSKPFFQPILDLDDPSYALSSKSHDNPRNPLRHPKHRSHEDHKDDQEEQQQWQEYIKNCLKYMKNTYAVVKEWMDKDEALWFGSKLGLDPNGELK